MVADRMPDYHRVDIIISMRSIPVPKGGKITVVGDIHCQEKLFDDLLECVKPTPENLLVSVGDVYGYGDDSIAESIIRKMTQTEGCCMVQGNHEAKRIRKAQETGEISPELSWVSQQPLSLPFVFDESRLRITVVHAGVAPCHTWSDLLENTDLYYVRNVDDQGRPAPQGTPWHELYDGRFGFIAAGHTTHSEPKFYPRCCNLDTLGTALTAQVFDARGKKQTIQMRP